MVKPTDIFYNLHDSRTILFWLKPKSIYYKKPKFVGLIN